MDGTTIKLLGDEQNLEIYVNFVDSICMTDEGRRIETYDSMEELQVYREKFYGNPIYEKSTSKYIDWLKKESLGFMGEVTHYMIVTRDDMIDIISSFPPQITVHEIH
ncbi:hypothetical protein [uncultured Vagococcus sp.]|uniref:hypothetical protein n=1 Tax=uncultured Vagococcus sp. TaxID=189676 RepID=UPI0028D49CE7|nr:hypothetical protein [uncultured Vagococcus sp.]